nr:hypothetical protein [Tanacetum cinerariifolium]
TSKFKQLLGMNTVPKCFGFQGEPLSLISNVSLLKVFRKARGLPNKVIKNSPPIHNKSWLASGKSIWKNPSGYLPGRMSPLQNFYGFMSLAFLVLRAVTFGTDKCTVSCLIILTILMGYGVVRPTLGGLALKIFMVEGTFFLAFEVPELVEHVGAISDLSGKAMLLLSLPMVMATLVISISSNVSVKSVGSSFPRVIIIDSISVEVPIALEVGAVAVVSPAGVLELDIHSSLEADPLESSPPPVSIEPMVLPFLCSDDSESDTELLERHVSPTTSTLEIPTAPILPTPSVIVAPPSEFPLASVVAPPEIHHSLSGHSSLDHSLSGHTPPDTIDADSSTPQRFVNPSLARTPRCIEAYLRWRSALLSTMYPLTAFDSSARDSSSESSAGPSCKRCRSPATTVTSHIYSARALVPSRANLLPPCKRFRDYVSPKDSIEEDIDTYVLEDIKVDATAIKVVVDRDVQAGIDVGISMEVNVGIDVEDEVEDEVESSDRGTIEVRVDMDVGIDIPDGMLMPDAVKRLDQVEDGLQNIHDHVIEIPLQRIDDIETTQRQLKANQLIASGDLRRHMSLSQEEFCQVCKDRDDTRRRLRRLESFVKRRLGFRP